MISKLGPLSVSGKGVLAMLKSTNSSQLTLPSGLLGNLDRDEKRVNISYLCHFLGRTTPAIENNYTVVSFATDYILYLKGIGRQSVHKNTIIPSRVCG